jgi:hypothetical protein
MKGFLGSFLAGRIDKDASRAAPTAAQSAQAESPAAAIQPTVATPPVPSAQSTEMPLFQQQSDGPRFSVDLREFGAGRHDQQQPVAASAAPPPTRLPEAEPSPTPLSPDDRAEADRLLAELRAGLAAICHERFGRDAWPAHLVNRMADAVVIAEGYVTDATKEVACGWNPLHLLRRQVPFALNLARTALAEPRASGMAGLNEIVPPPVVPKGAPLFFLDENGRPTDARRSVLWCWEGGPRWYYTAQNPVPSGHPIA